MFKKIYDYYYFNIKSFEDRDPVVYFTYIVILLTFLRIVSMVYTVLILKIHAGKYGLFQLPAVYPFYVIHIVLCFIFLSKRHIYKIRMISFLIYCLVFMGLDIYFYVNAIDPTSAY